MGHRVITRGLPVDYWTARNIRFTTYAKLIEKTKVEKFGGLVSDRPIANRCTNIDTH